MPKLIVLVLLISFISIFPIQAQAFVTHDEKQLELWKATGTSLYYKPAANMISQARKVLQQPMPNITEKSELPPSGDSHDYVSLGIYYWPDPAKADGLPYINRDGYVNPEKDDLTRYDAKRLDKMTYAVNTLALAYYLTNEEAFAAKAATILDTWFINPATRMNPNLNFGQIHPGNRVIGSYSGIIETVPLINLTDSIYILENSSHFTAEQQASVKRWFNEYLDWLLYSELGKKECATGNNHSVWYDAQTAVYAHFVGRDDLARQILSEVPEKRIALQIEPDGKTPRELARTRSKHYTLFILMAFTDLGRLGDILGINLFDYYTADGRSIRTAWDWFTPYALEEQPWPYKEISPFSPAELLHYLQLANLHYQNPQYEATITKAFLKK